MKLLIDPSVALQTQALTMAQEYNQQPFALYLKLSACLTK